VLRRLSGAAAALGLGALAAATALAGPASEGPRMAPRPALVSNGSEQVRSDLGTYCVESSPGPGQQVGQCADALPPSKPPTPRLQVAPARELVVRFRHRQGLADEVAGFSASLARAGGKRGFETFGPALEPRRVAQTKRRWSFLLPQDLGRANALSIFATLETGDAMFTIGLRRLESGAAPLICPATGGDAFDTAELIGLTLAEAEALAARHDCIVRVGELDGEPQVGTADYRTDRVNVAVTGGRVERILGVG
jgi:hypothetical protein